MLGNLNYSIPAGKQKGGLCSVAAAGSSEEERFPSSCYGFVMEDYRFPTSGAFCSKEADMEDLDSLAAAPPRMGGSWAQTQTTISQAPCKVNCGRTFTVKIFGNGLLRRPGGLR